MNIYLISQSEKDGYDTYESAVVIAPDEESARHTHPRRGIIREWWHYDWASSPERVMVQLIGTAAPGAEPGVVCASFNAG